MYLRLLNYEKGVNHGDYFYLIDYRCCFEQGITQTCQEACETVGVSYNNEGETERGGGEEGGGQWRLFMTLC